MTAMAPVTGRVPGEGFTAHDGMGFEFGAGRVSAASAARISELRHQIGGEPLVGIDHRYGYRFAKRTFDIVFSAAVLVVFCWLFVLIAILIKIDDPKGPVLFSQERVGRHDKVFRMHKFRSMSVDAEERLEEIKHLNEKTGPVFKMNEGIWRNGLRSGWSGGVSGRGLGLSGTNRAGGALRHFGTSLGLHSNV